MVIHAFYQVGMVFGDERCSSQGPGNDKGEQSRVSHECAYLDETEIVCSGHSGEDLQVKVDPMSNDQEDDYGYHHL